MAATFFFRKLPMFQFLLIVQTIIAASLVGVILVQRSEGGGLGVGGSSSGFMTARGAADFLTRSTAVLGGLFVILSIFMAAYAGIRHQPAKVDTSLANQVSGAPSQTQPQQQPATTNDAGAAGNQSAPAVPLQQ